MTRRKYEPGDLVNGILFLREVEASGKNRRAVFECPVCKNEMECLICNVVNGDKIQCGCIPTKRNKVLESYKEGQLINGINFVKEVERRKQHRMGLFICPLCTEQYVTYIHSVVKGKSKSCGCQNGSLPKHGHSAGGKVTPEYEAWCAIKQRCYSEGCDMYYAYGGRGIKVCQRWMESFQNFFEDMGKRPSSKHSIDRINVNGNYEPNNCRWATTKEQGRNRRNNLLVTYKGQTKPLCEWSEQLNLEYEAVRVRIQIRKWTVEDAFTIPIFEKWKCHPGSKKEYLNSLKPVQNFIPHAFGVVNV